MLPVKYDARSVQQELNKLNEGVRALYQFIPMIPLDSSPVEPLEGYIALSNGTGGGFDGTSCAGLYRYSGSYWVFVG